MNKNEFMEILSEKLKELSSEDRDDAVNYYWEYFEEAGFGDESDVTKNVGMPEEAAAKIIEAAEHVKESKFSAITDLAVVDSEEPDDFESVDIELSTLDVIIKAGDKFGILVNCKDKKPEIEKVNNCLKVRDRDKENFGFSGINFNFNIFNREKEFVEITVPRDKRLKEVKGKLGFGKLSLFSINSDMLSVETDMGSIEAIGVTASKNELSANMGHISVKDGKYDKLIVENNTGAVNIKYSEAEYLKISTDTGYISMNRVNAKEADLISHTGYIKLADGKADRLFMGTGTGLIRLDGTNTRNLEVKSGTGSISVKLPGGRDRYCLDLADSLGVISVEGKNSGSSIFGNSYRDNTGEIPVKLRVDTGKINVDFNNY